MWQKSIYALPESLLSSSCLHLLLLLTFVMVEADWWLFWWSGAFLCAIQEAILETSSLCRPSSKLAVWQKRAGGLKGFGESLHSLYTDRKATEPAHLLVAVHEQIVAGPVDREAVDHGGGVKCQPVDCGDPISSAFHAWLQFG